MTDDQTAKERLSTWYHHETIPLTIAGTVGKLVLEGIFWFVVMSVIVVLGILVPLPLVGNTELFGQRYWVFVTVLAASTTIAEFCIFTLPPDALD